MNHGPLMLSTRPANRCYSVLDVWSCLISRMALPPLEPGAFDTYPSVHSLSVSANCFPISRNKRLSRDHTVNKLQKHGTVQKPLSIDRPALPTPTWSQTPRRPRLSQNPKPKPNSEPKPEPKSKPDSSPNQRRRRRQHYCPSRPSSSSKSPTTSWTTTSPGETVIPAPTAATSGNSTSSDHAPLTKCSTSV